MAAVADIIPAGPGGQLIAQIPNRGMVGPARPPIQAPLMVAPAGGLPIGFTGANIPGLANGPLGADDYQDALNRVSLLGGYITDADVVRQKAQDFNDFALNRLRQIFKRLQSLGQIAGGNSEAATSLVELVRQINASGGPTLAQVNAMQTLADELSALNINDEMSGLVDEVNQLAGALNAQAGPNGIGVVGGRPGDQAQFPMQGGRKRKKARKKTKKKRQQGGYKFTRVANSRRSLRMSRRKSMGKQKKKRGKKKNTHKKRKRTKGKRTKGRTKRR
jgi:hypothetical protein